MIHDMQLSELINLLERATARVQAGPDQTRPDEPEVEAEWVALVRALKLPIRYLPAVQRALAQGRWRTAKNPQAYIRTVARREALATNSGRDRKSTLRIPEDARNEEGEPLSLEEYIDFRCSGVGAVKLGGRWKARNPVYEPIFMDDEGRAIPCVNGRPVPEELLMLEDDEPDAKLVINWQKVAERAGVDEEEVMILALRRAGFTRAAILSRYAKNDELRRAWQAAWRRLDRHMDRIRAVFSGSAQKPAMSPKHDLRILHK